MTAGLSDRPLWFWCLFGAVTMSLGWGLRGYIGGGPLGAMIPGAMIGLAICMLLGREKDSGLVAAFAAIGVGFGGQETYGQTVGLAFQPETYHWAILGFAVKGAAWGLLGGALIGISLTLERYRRKDLLAGFGLMILGTFAGWKLLNEPKLIYFSNPVDRPRPELWFGLWLGGACLLLWLTCRGAARLPLHFALWGVLGGGIGFALGAALQVWGRPLQLPYWRDWWKTMEFTFGALLGLAYVLCAWIHRSEIDAPRGSPANPVTSARAVAHAAMAIAIGLILHPIMPARFNFTVAGAMLLALALKSEAFSWQTAVTLTYAAFTYDLVKNRPDLSHSALWIFAVTTTMATALYAARNPGMRKMFRLLTASSVIIAIMKGFIPPAEAAAHASVHATFLVMAIALMIWTRTPTAALTPTVPFSRERVHSAGS